MIQKKSQYLFGEIQEGFLEEVAFNLGLVEIHMNSLGKGSEKILGKDTSMSKDKREQCK